MDFIVLGSILGAILIAAGRGGVEFLPRRLPVPSDDESWLEVRDRRRLVRLLRAGGRMLVVVGVVVLIATITLVLLASSDGAALTTVLILGVGGLLATAGLLAWYRYQDSTGAIQRRQLRSIRSRLGPARPAGTRRPDVARDRDSVPGGRDREPDPRGRRPTANRAGEPRMERRPGGDDHGRPNPPSRRKPDPREPEESRQSRGNDRPPERGTPDRTGIPPRRPADRPNAGRQPVGPDGMPRRPAGRQPTGSYPRPSNNERR